MNKDRLLFNTNYVNKVKDLAPRASDALNKMADDQYPRIYQDTPMHKSPDFVSILKEMVQNNPMDQLLS